MGFVTQRLRDYAVKRLQEPSTWAGIIAAATAAAGYNAPPDVQAQLVQVGIALSGLLLVFVREGRNRPDNPTLPSVLRGPDAAAGVQVQPPAAPAIPTHTEPALQPERGPAIPAEQPQPIRPGFGDHRA